MTPEVDLSDLPTEATDRILGELVRLLLSRDGVAILALSPDGGTMTTLSPSIACSSEDLATALLAAGWTEERVLTFLDNRRST